LAKAESYWDYDNGYSIPKVGQVVDYTNKETTTINDSYPAKLTEKIVLNDKIHILTVDTLKYGVYEFGALFMVIVDAPSVIEVTVLKNNKILHFSTHDSRGIVGETMTTITTDNLRIDVIKESSFYVRFIINENVFTCPNGGTLSGNMCYINKTITKCPVGYTETTGAEVAKGECKGNIDYSYYEYKCNEEKNGQNNNYQIINNGGDCNKSDTNNKTV
ncbi:hypothetical protein ACOL23_12225, partial [Aliarcobacter butzleri]